MLWPISQPTESKWFTHTRRKIDKPVEKWNYFKNITEKSHKFCFNFFRMPLEWIIYQLIECVCVCVCLCISILCLHDQVYSPLNLFLVGMTEGEGLKDHISATYF